MNLLHAQSPPFAAVQYSGGISSLNYLCWREFNVIKL